MEFPIIWWTVWSRMRSLMWYGFQQMAKEAMEGIYARGRIPVLVGGTGFYIRSNRDIGFYRYTERIRLIGGCWKTRQRLRERRCFMRCLLLWILRIRGSDSCEQCQTGDPRSGILSADRKADLSITKNSGRKNPI